MTNQETTHPHYLRWSFGLLLLALFFAVLTGVVLDAALAPLSLTLQRGIVVVTLIFPAVLGTLMGLLALRPGSSRRLLALVSVILNGLFALFYIFLLAIAG